MIELTMFSPLNLVLIAALNPVVALVGFVMGRSCDQRQKLMLAGFAAALAGAAAVWIAVWLGILTAKGIGGEAGVFVLSIGMGTVWAAIGMATQPKNRVRRTETRT